MKTEKYLSGALHWSEVMDMFNKLDIVDKENFIYALENDEFAMDVIREMIECYENY